MDNKSIIVEMNDTSMQAFKAIAWKYKKDIFGITPVHGRIIMYIYDASEMICQKDIEKHLSCTKSTMSSILDTMEKNGMIVRKSINNDMRKKNIILTDKANKIAKILQREGNKLDDLLIQNITSEELKIFQNVLRKIQKNIERM